KPQSRSLVTHPPSAGTRLLGMTAGRISFAARSSKSFLVFRLVQLDLESTRHAEMRNEPVPTVRDVVGELHATTGKLPHRLFNVVAVERDVVRARWIARTDVGGVTA